MVAPETETGASKSTEADNAGNSSNGTGINHSAMQSDNQRTSEANPTQTLVAQIAAGERDAAYHTSHEPAPRPSPRILSRSTCLVTRSALNAQAKADIRVRFKLTDATFEQLPLAKTLEAVQILTKLANRAVKFAKQDVAHNELISPQGKLLFSPFVVQAHAPQKTQIAPQLAHPEAWETVPKLVSLSGVKQGCNILLAICHFYNAAVTRAGLKSKITKITSTHSAGNTSDADPPDAQQIATVLKLRKLSKRLQVYVENQFPKLTKFFDLFSKSHAEAEIADLVNKDLFLFILNRIVSHDVIKEKQPSARINLSLLNDVVAQARGGLSGTSEEGSVARARPVHLRNASLNAVVSSFITAYVKMERNFFRECRVRARLLLLERLCSLAVMVKYRIPGYSVEFGKHKDVTSASSTEDVTGNDSESSSDTPSADALVDAAAQESSVWFESLPKTRTAARVILEGFDDCILGADQGFPAPFRLHSDHQDANCVGTETLSGENRGIFRKYQKEHPEFTLHFKLKKFVVSAPNTNDVLRTSDFTKVPSVAYTNKVDLLALARDYLMELLGCASWLQLLSVHEKVLYTVISFARSLLAITKDYIEGSNGDSDDNETDEVKDNAHMQMFFVTTNSKQVRPVQTGNVAGVIGLKKELPGVPDSDNSSNTAFISTLHEFFDSKSLKAIALKICIGRNEYDNTVTDSSRPDCDEIEELDGEATGEEPLTKTICFTFEDDSDAGSSE